MTETIIVTIRWDGGDKARLFYLIDNGKVMVGNGEHRDGEGEIRVVYQADAFAIHHIEWALWFPERKLRGLRAVVTVHGGPEQRLGAEDEKTSKWSSEATARANS